MVCISLYIKPRSTWSLLRDVIHYITVLGYFYSTYPKAHTFSHRNRVNGGVVGDWKVGDVGRESHSSLSSGHQHNTTVTYIVHCVMYYVTVVSCDYCSIHRLR